MDETRANHSCSPTAVNWSDARFRVLKSYREWLRAVSNPINRPISLELGSPSSGFDLSFCFKFDVRMGRLGKRGEEPSSREGSIRGIGWND